LFDLGRLRLESGASVHGRHRQRSGTNQ
jgi:hypothetical protein